MKEQPSLFRKTLGNLRQSQAEERRLAEETSLELNNAQEVLESNLLSLLKPMANDFWSKFPGQNLRQLALEVYNEIGRENSPLLFVHKFSLLGKRDNKEVGCGSARYIFTVNRSGSEQDMPVKVKYLKAGVYTSPPQPEPIITKIKYKWEHKEKEGGSMEGFELEIPIWDNHFLNKRIVLGIQKQVVLRLQRNEEGRGGRGGPSNAVSFPQTRAGIENLEKRMARALVQGEFYYGWSVSSHGW